MSSALRRTALILSAHTNPAPHHLTSASVVSPPLNPRCNNRPCPKHPSELLHLVAAHSSRPRLRCRLCSTAATRGWRESHPMQCAWQSLVQRAKRKYRDSDAGAALGIKDLSWERVGRRAVEGALKALHCKAEAAVAAAVAVGESDPMRVSSRTVAGTETIVPSLSSPDSSSVKVDQMRVGTETSTRRNDSSKPTIMFPLSSLSFVLSHAS
jgi:hypothetical protein